MSKKIHRLSKRNWKCFFVGFILAWILAGGCCAAFAGVPVKFTVETSRADVQEVQCYHGETLDFDVTFKNYGKDLYFPTNTEAQIFWQTNGMSAFYWRTNNVNVVSNHMMATFTPEMDPGTGTVFGFIGIPGDIYRASFVLRLKQSPGWKVKEMEWPYRELDFLKVEVKNAPYYLKSETYKREEIEAILQAYDLYRNATNREEVIVSNLTEWAQNEFRTKEDSYTKTQIDSFLALLQTRADAITATNTLDTAIRAWAESEFQKSWELEEVQLGKDATATGTKTTAIGAYSTASGISAIAFGNGAEAKGTYPIAIGLYAKGTNGNSVAVGSYADAVNGGVAIGAGGQWTPVTAKSAGVAVGTGTAADTYGVAIGYGAKAGNQSIAIGREAKAEQVGSVAIGPTATTTAANQMRLAYSADEIMIGAWYPESLRAVIERLAPPPDITKAEVEGLIRAAKFMPSEDSYVQGSTTVKVFKTTRTQGSPLWRGYPYNVKYTIEGLTEEETGKTSGGEYRLTFGTNTVVNFESGAKLTLKGTRIIADKNVALSLREPKQIKFGSTNLAELVQSAKPADYETVKEKANAAAPQATTYTKAEVDAKVEYADVPSNVVWRIEAEGGRFFFKPVRPINEED